MTGGSSGGAWLRWFDGNWGYINGLNSYKYNNDPNTMYSPYFGDAASSLSGGQRKMLGIAKALAAEPKLLVMDEPSAGLSPLFVKEVIRVLSDLQGRGLALLIAEQNIGFLEVATRVFVLEGGRIRFSGTVAEMSDNEALRRAYFGLK